MQENPYKVYRHVVLFHSDFCNWLVLENKAYKIYARIQGFVNNKSYKQINDKK